MSTIKVKKNAFSGTDDKRIQTLDCWKASSYETSKEIINKNGKINKQKLLKKY